MYHQGALTDGEGSVRFTSVRWVVSLCTISVSVPRKNLRCYQLGQNCYFSYLNFFLYRDSNFV